MPMRLDKFLANAGIGTRSEVKKMIRSGRITVDGEMVKRPEYQTDETYTVALDGGDIQYSKFEYYMLNKPAGVVSATVDECTTVVELIKETKHRDLFPVGRLDKDTEGLLIITNDGKLAHDLLSPGKHVSKTYFVRVDGFVNEDDVRLFGEGVDIGDDKLTKPAVIKNIRHIQDKDTQMTELLITITEGRYHQIKRMFAKIKKPVLYLKRIAMGELKLDEKLGLGEYRLLSSDELNCLKGQDQC